MDRKIAIKIALTRSGITQNDIAKNLKLSKSHISNVIAGRCKSAPVEKVLNDIVKRWEAAV